MSEFDLFEEIDKLDDNTFIEVYHKPSDTSYKISKENLILALEIEGTAQTPPIQQPRGKVGPIGPPGKKTRAKNLPTSVSMEDVASIVTISKTKDNLQQIDALDFAKFFDASGFGFSWRIIPLGTKVTIPWNKEMSVHEGISVDGDLTIDGYLIIED